MASGNTQLETQKETSGTSQHDYGKTMLGFSQTGN